MSDVASVGERLWRARDARGLDLQQAADGSGVGSVATIQTLERGDPDELVAQPRLLALVRMYARYLGLDAEALLAELVAAAGSGAAAGGGPPAAPVAPLQPPRRPRRRRRLLLAGLVTALVVLAGAAGVTAMMVGGIDYGDVSLPDVLGGSSPVAIPSPSPGPSPAAPQPTTSATPVAAASPPSTPGAASPAVPSLVGPDGSPADGAGGADGGLPGRPPGETRVQLLDGSVGSLPVGRAEDVLIDLGYDVVQVVPMVEPVATSSVYYTSGWETEARSLVARESRFGSVGANPGFDAEVDLHVVMGRDWAGAGAGGGS